MGITAKFIASDDVFEVHLYGKYEIHPRRKRGKGEESFEFSTQSFSHSHPLFLSLEPQPKNIIITSFSFSYFFFQGTFLQPITPNATWTFLAKYDPSSSNPDHESGSVDFCTSMDSIEQLPPLYSHFPDSHPRTQSCPPEKGYALIMMSAWVMPMFIVPVSSCCLSLFCSAFCIRFFLGEVKKWGGKVQLFFFLFFIFKIWKERLGR